MAVYLLLYLGCDLGVSVRLAALSVQSIQRSIGSDERVCKTSGQLEWSEWCCGLLLDRNHNRVSHTGSEIPESDVCFSGWHALTSAF